MSSKDKESFDLIYSEAIKNCTDGLIEKVKTPAANARTGKIPLQKFVVFNKSWHCG
jgi:hypothetical protein